MTEPKPKRPYYIKRKRAVIVPVKDWQIAQVMFWKKDSKKK